MLVLGIDPGTATTGYGLVRYYQGQEQLVDYGIIKTAASEPMYTRLHKLYRQLQELLATYEPDIMSVEQLFYQKNSKTIITVAQGRGVALLAAADKGIKIAEYTPLQVKQAVVGYGRADKKQVQLMVQRLLGLEFVPKPDDASDALAVAICHIHSFRLGIIEKRW